ncbi:MAG: hypothetical protein VX228_06405, partial [Pseudomonadota bacterium]|nr:hypothetical protein [Pseudomonadota bacterium]
AIDRRIGMALGSLVMAASLGLYLVLGRADLPAQPLAERGAEIAAALKQAETAAAVHRAYLARAEVDAERWRAVQNDLQSMEGRDAPLSPLLRATAERLFARP